jgi:hypothetical protein
VRFLGLAMLSLVALGAPARADPPASDEQADARVAEMIAHAREVYGVHTARTVCKPSTGDEIVVCADHGRDQRVPSTAETDPDSLAGRQYRDGGVPTAPDLERHFHGVSAARGCFVGPCPKPPVYYVDLKALPEPPPGSDADKIAKGDAPAP